MNKKEKKHFEESEALIEITSGIAHIINNLLMGIQGNISLILFDIDNCDSNYEKLKKIESYIRKGSTFSDHLLDFANGKIKPVTLENFQKLISHYYQLDEIKGDRTGSALDQDQSNEDSIMLSPLDIIDIYEECAIKDKTVLLVDDENMILDVGKKLLEKLGFNVLKALSGREAIAIYLEKKDDIDMIILDFKMPDMDGGETFYRLKEINPNVKVLLSSGYGNIEKVREILKDGCKGLIKKPFTFETLSKKIMEILNVNYTFNKS